MFLFNRKSKKNAAANSVSNERQQARKRMVKQTMEDHRQERDRAYNDMADMYLERGNIAAYFNRHRYDVEGYEMTIRQKDGDRGSVELARPFEVTAKTIGKIQESSDVFLEGHAYTQNGVIGDIYDSAHPAEILRQNLGEQDILRTCDLDKYEQERLNSKPSIGPKTRVIAVDDPMDIPIR
ncbi:MAG: hypothetical protein U0M72_06675 [Eggerthellaceae bacterium]